MLNLFFEPTSVAVIGASKNPLKLGYEVLKNLTEGGYHQRGKIYPINPGGTEILGYPAFPSVMEVPGSVDLVAIVIPYAQVPDVLRDDVLVGFESLVGGTAAASAATDQPDAKRIAVGRSKSLPDRMAGAAKAVVNAAEVLMNSRREVAET